MSESSNSPGQWVLVVFIFVREEFLILKEPVLIFVREYLLFFKERSSFFPESACERFFVKKQPM